jgi:aminoglycoside phosphotransferase (APT) family kinase protein
MSEVPGKVDLIPMNIESWLEQQAEFLVRLHQVEPGDFPWKYRPYFAPAQLKVPEWSRHKGLWEEAIEIVRSPAPETPIRFIHRDYHPVNVLWQRGRLTGVVDWVNSCLGPAGVDVAWCRHNLAGAYGVPMADRFLAICQEAMGTDWEYSPFWDLQTLMELLPGPIDVYPPWREFGLGHLTVELITRRIEDYLASLLNGI